MNERPPDLDVSVQEKGPEAVLREIMLAPIALLNDETLTDLVKVVTRGQYFHEGTRAFLREEFFKRPNDLLVDVLRRFEELGLVHGYAPEFLAAELQPVITASFYRSSLEPGYRRFNFAETMLAVEKHVSFFWHAAKSESF